MGIRLNIKLENFETLSNTGETAVLLDAVTTIFGVVVVFSCRQFSTFNITKTKQKLRIFNLLALQFIGFLRDF